MLGIMQGQAVGVATPVAATKFQPQASDVWVNSLWFTSLGLSLATALIAVLTKQWIHEYATVPTGTHRARARIRHYRYMALTKWRVPLIIELLPVLMHVSLGLFFLGLVIYLHSMFPPLALDRGLIAGVICFLFYIVSTALPLIYPECPYRTPVSSNSLMLVAWLKHCINSVQRQVSQEHSRDCVRQHTPSLHDLELEAVDCLSDGIEAHALAWLYKTTSHLSVQSVVIQSISALPLESLPFITGPNGMPSALETFDDHFHYRQPLDRYERFQRAALRLRNDSNRDIDIMSDTEHHSIFATLRDPIGAVELVKSSLVGRAGPPIDAVVWGAVLSKALAVMGTEWLEASSTEASHVWSELLRAAIVYHNCSVFGCDGHTSRKPLLTFPEPEELEDLPHLVIDYYNRSTNGLVSSVGEALTQSMSASLLQLIMHIGYPTATRSAVAHTQNLPDDILLLLLMVQTPSVQKTSSMHQVWYAHDQEVLRHKRSVFCQLVHLLEQYALAHADYVPARHAEEVERASIFALQRVLKSDTYGLHTTMTLEDEILVLSIVFRALNIELYHRKSRVHDFLWLTPETSRRLLDVAFSANLPDSDEVYELVSNILAYLLCSGHHIESVLLIYNRLVERSWLRGSASVGDTSHYPDLPDNSTELDPLHCWVPRHTSQMAALHVDGLPVLASHCPETYQLVLDDLQDPVTGNLLTLCKLLLIADIDTQERLWKLAKLVRAEHWAHCLEALCTFASSQVGEKLYGEATHGPQVGLGAKPIRHLAWSQIQVAAASFAEDVRRHSYAPPDCASQDLHVSQICITAAKSY